MRILPGLDFNRAGKYGVYLFFALSAFLLTYPFFLRPAGELIKTRVWSNYWLRRALRVLPLYYLVVTVTNFRKDSFTNLEWWNHLLLRDGDSHFWTIPVEFKYYAVLPVLVLALGWVWRVKGWKWGVGALAVFYVVFLHGIFFPVEKAWSLEEEVKLSRSIYSFLAGSLAGVLHAWMVRSGFRLRGLPLVAEVTGWGALLAVFLFIPGVYNVLLNAGRDVKNFQDMDEVCAVLWPVFLLGLIYGTGWLRRLFEMRWLRYIGFVSYSAYLWHRIILGEVDDLKNLPPLVAAVLFIGITFIVATVTYWLVERPLSRIRLQALPTPRQIEEAAAGA